MTSIVDVALALLIYPSEAALPRLRRRLALSNQAFRQIQMMLSQRNTVTPSLSDAMQKKLIRRLGAPSFMESVIVAWAAGQEPVAPDHPYAAMLQLAQSWQPPLFPVSGGDLIARGLAPGKALGEALRQLEERWEESGYRLSKEELLKNL